MTRSEAERLMAGYLEMSAAVGRTEADISSLVDEADRQQAGQIFTEIVCFIYERGMRPLIAQFPDLDPDKTPNAQ